MAQRWVVSFTEGTAEQIALLGGKGAGLADMTRLGLPVPPGYTVTTETCRSYLQAGGEPPAKLWDDVHEALGEIEQRTGRRLGDPRRPLLVSVRSGAAISMPGMMDTILNLGLNQETAAGLAELTDERFALDSYRRLIQMFGKIALSVEGDPFEQALSAAKHRAGVAHDHELPPAALRDLVVTFKGIVAAGGATFPDDPKEQLRLAILAVFRSWNTERAVAYRRSHGISDDIGTAANVQAMVFGNMGPDSATGVAFTRDPNSGERRLFGEFLPNAQGEDVVAGTRTPLPLERMAEEPCWQLVHRQLQATADQLEAHYRDMQDIEFTVEQGRLWMLQTRAGKRTAQAAVTIAVAQVGEGLIERATAVRRVEPAQLEQLLHPRVDESRPLEVIATGLPASPGAATGRVVFDEAEARERGEAGEAIILVRIETSADDFPGMERARGILTARGGMPSHAAVVARGMGKPAVTGCAEIEIDEAAG
ncbi:MAG: pyruvate, phosphate dikinase, partial [Thermomicrobiales bacterium]